MHKFMVGMALILFSNASVLLAEANIDSLDKKIDKVLDNQDIIINNVENNPLKGKKFGVEFNPLRALFNGAGNNGSTMSETSLSGAFSVFDIENKVEYAFPIFYYNMEDSLDNSQFRLISVDVQYRKFLGETLNGFFLTGLLRGAQLKGTVWNSFTGTRSGAASTENKLGLGFGIGYRVFSESGWYWGTSLIGGRYFTGKHDKFLNGGPIYDDSEIFYDMDILKFGYAF